MNISYLCFIFVLFYRPRTKLREGNVFTGVCQSVNRRGVALCPPPFRDHYTLPLRTVPPETYTPWQYSPQQCTSPEGQWDIVSKRPERILLECFLVDYILLIFPDQELLNQYQEFLKQQTEILLQEN